MVIATPPSTHAGLALKAIAAGKHVYTEKPLAGRAQSVTSDASAPQPDTIPQLAP